MFDEYIECVSVEVEKHVLKTSKNVVISVIYRPPNTDVRIFIDKMNILLDTIMKEHKLCYLLGDYNINILNYDTHDTTVEFIDILYSHAILPLINRPTRVTQSSATAIDKIFTACFQILFISLCFPKYGYYLQISLIQKMNSSIINNLLFAEFIWGCLFTLDTGHFRRCWLCITVP